LPIEKLIGRVDVFHSSDWTQPPTRAFKVTTVHDLIPLKFPKLVHPQIVAVHQRRLVWVKREVDRVIVPSTQTKEDLVNFGVPGDKIRLIGEAPVSVRPSSDKITAVKQKYRLGHTKYLLAVGVNPLKNTARIIKAFYLAGGGEKLKLVVAGRPVNIKVGEQRGVRLIGPVPDGELAALYAGAEALVYPSLAEGFGLPILDAFACGTPVVTSNLEPMKETAGDAAILVNPYQTNTIAEGMVKALRGKKGWVDKGLKRVKDFSWTRAAQETQEVYKEMDR
jgi:glycosyltransferase involved in cell wall biosynthesis